MRDSVWVIVNATGIRRMAKGRRSRHDRITRPELKAGEYAVLVTLSVPDSVFRPRALPEATIEVPEWAVVTPDVRTTVEQPPPPASDDDDYDDADVVIAEHEVRGEG